MNEEIVISYDKNLVLSAREIKKVISFSLGERADKKNYKIGIIYQKGDRLYYTQFKRLYDPFVKMQCMGDTPWEENSYSDLNFFIKWKPRVSKNPNDGDLIIESIDWYNTTAFVLNAKNKRSGERKQFSFSIVGEALKEFDFERHDVYKAERRGYFVKHFEENWQ